MTKILFICHGNICRSTMAEFVFADMVKKAGRSDEFVVASAATSREEIGNGVHHGTKRKLAEEGVPVYEHRAVQVTKEDYAKYDYLIVMDSQNMRNIKKIIHEDPHHKIVKLLDFSLRPRDIADPWYTGNFDITYDDIVEGCSALLAKI